MDPTIAGLVEQRARILSLLCGSLLMSLGIYVVVAVIVLRSDATLPSGVPTLVVWVVAALAIATVGAGETIARAMIARRSVEATTPAARLDAYQQATILGFAIREWGGVLGLVATLLSGQLAWCVGLCAAVAVTMLAAWPRRERLAAIATGGPAPIG